MTPWVAPHQVDHRRRGHGAKRLGVALAAAVLVCTACPGAQRRVSRFERAAAGATPETPETTVPSTNEPVPTVASPSAPPLVTRHEDRVVSFTVRDEPVNLRATAMWSTVGDDVVNGPVFLIVPGAGDVSRRGLRRRNGVDTYVAPIAVTTAWQELLSAAGVPSLAWDKRTCGPNDDVDCQKNPQNDIDEEGPVAMAADIDAACALATTVPGFDGRIVLLAHGQSAQVALSSSCAVRAAAIVLVSPPPREIDAVLVDALQSRLQHLTEAHRGRLPAEQALAATELRNLAASTSARFASMRAGKFSREARVEGATIAFWLGWMSLTHKTPELVAAVKDKTFVVLGSRDSQLSDDDMVRAKGLPARATLVFAADHHLLVDGALTAEVGLAVIDAVAALLGPSPS
jgi:hypothetical protein